YVNPSFIAVTSDKSLTAMAEDDNILLKDSGGRALHVLTQQRGTAALAFSSDGNLLASGSNGEGEGAIKVWDLSTGRESKVLDNETQWVLALAFSPNNLQLAAGGQGVRILDIQTGRRIRELGFATDTITSIAFSRDGSKLASAGRNSTIW